MGQLWGSPMSERALPALSRTPQSFHPSHRESGMGTMEGAMESLAGFALSRVQ